MKFDTIHSYLEGIGSDTSIPLNHAKVLYDFILAKKPSECLELGFGHGVSSCYTAAALDEIGSGHLTSVDIVPAMKWQKPSIEELLSLTKLSNYVTVMREKTSYTWFLKKMIEENSSSDQCKPIYDFCFIDGPHNWAVDGLGFFLVDKLLKNDGWILFDDLKWTYAEKLKQGQTHSGGFSLFEMGDDERNTPHVDLIFRLLVMEHPDYSEFRIEDDWWAWAHKISSSEKKLIVKITNNSIPIRAARKIGRILQSINK